MATTEETTQDMTPADNAAARMWGLGGRAYDLVSFAISDALGHGAQRLAPEPGERVLDVATGTGWTARNLALMGAEVTAVDFSHELLEAARALSAHCRPPIRFALADAQALPFGDAAFDRAISTFGAMFAPDQQATAAELARVVKPGGRLVMVNWVPGGSVAEFFALLGGYDDTPPPAASPLDWGDPDRVTALLGEAFELTFERGTNHAHHESEQSIRDWYSEGFGPVRALETSLDETRLAALRRDIDAYHAPYRTEAGLRIPRDYLVVIGRRR